MKNSILLTACQEEIMPDIYDKIERKYEDEADRYITDNGSKMFFRKIYSEVERMLKHYLNSEKTREEIRDMGYPINFDKITQSDIDSIADDITWRIVEKLLYGHPFFTKEELGLKGHKTIAPSKKSPFNLNVRNMF